MSTHRLLIPLAAAATLSLCASASATKLPKFHQAAFKATVEGIQTTKWTADHPSTGRCDQSMHGSGSERVTFASSRAVKIKAFQIGNSRPSLTGPGGPADLPTRGAVTRTGTLQLGPLVPECEVGDGGGSSVPPPSDCGRKTIPSLLMEVQYDPADGKRITLSNEPVQAPRFAQCPNMGNGWPAILSIANGRAIGEALPAHDLFDRRQGKTIVLGKGTATGGDGGIHWTTHVEWTLTLKRVKGGTR